MDDKVVRVTLQNGIPVPDQDPVQVKKDQQKIRWAADFDFRITIDGYDDVKCTGNECKTGVFKDERQYKYTISANGHDNDPMVEVQP
jgi:hypothetical protein